MNGTTSTITPQEEQLSERAKTHSVMAYAAERAGLAPTSIRRRASRPQDVEIEILYCGQSCRQQGTENPECLYFC